MALMLIFSVDEIRYALPVADVESVVRMVRMEPAPAGKRGIIGTVDFHGSVLPVRSVRRIFGHYERPPRMGDVLVIVRLNGEFEALWADESEGVREMQVADPDMPPGTDRDFPAGTFMAGDGTIVIGNTGAILAGDPVNGNHGGIPSGHVDLTSEFAGDRGNSGSDKTRDLTRIQAILNERAGNLARPGSAGTAKIQLEFLRFRLMYQEYAIGMQYVREVVLTGDITPVPGTPDFIAGICAVRGEIISLVDLRPLFSLTEKGLTDLNRVIVLTDNKLTFGILADHITGVGTIDMDQHPPIPAALPIDRKYILGVTGDSMIILDAAVLLSDPRMMIDEKEG